MNRAKPIKPFKTLEAEARFWDTHELSELFVNPTKSLKKLPVLESEKEEIMTVRIQKSVKTNIERVARLKGINPSTLARMWLIEKLHQVLGSAKKANIKPS